ncbi:MAG: hypothetical protein IJE26_05325, partial [Oscillospiraceae bacterium]|nr:hypothetical protein [Oscillospiraceae bacterium]
CQRCGFKYSGLKTSCPKCGAPRANQSTRAAATTASVSEGTAARARAQVNGQWQLIFAGILLVTVLLAVVVLIAGGGDNSVRVPADSPSQGSQGDAQQGISISDTYLPSPSPSPEPTPEGPDPNAITSLQLVFLDTPLESEFTMSNAGELSAQLECRTFPQNVNAVIEWSSSDDTVLAVDDTGLITIVGVDPSASQSATITAKVGELTASVIVRVPYYQAAYLTENRYMDAKNAG